MGKYSFSDIQDQRREERRPKPKAKKFPIKDNKKELEIFFEIAAQELQFKPYCEECGEFIPSDYYRAATAHVIPKRKDFGFPSVATNPINKLFLGAGCGCHSKYDISWESASKMKIWPKAVVIFKKLYKFISESELKNIPDILLKTLD